MKTKLAIDMGSTSMGWALLRLGNDNEPCGIVDMGVRIFSNSRDGDNKSLAVSRREARSIRRQLDRRQKRKADVMAKLIEYGLMPKSEEERKKIFFDDKKDNNHKGLNPYECRAKVVTGKADLYEIGRALFHISQRRGFKSNGKVDNDEEQKNKMGIMEGAIRDLDGRLGSNTLGQYLYHLNDDDRTKNPIPLRVRPTTVGSKNESYNLYPNRSMYENEVRKIFETQQVHYKNIITEEAISDITRAIFFQRNFYQEKLIEKLIGSCPFEEGEKRGRLAYPIVQRFRILQEVNNLSLKDDPYGTSSITSEQKKIIIDNLYTKEALKFSEIRKLLFGKNIRAKFNLESNGRTALKGDKTTSMMSDEKGFGKNWYNLSNEDKNTIVDLWSTKSDEEIISKLKNDYNLPEKNAEYIAKLNLNKGYGNLSVKAIEKILPFLEQGMLYSDAVKSAGYSSHSDFRNDGEIFDELPYYGELLRIEVTGGSHNEKDKDFPEKYWGKISNPTVHVALNQVRKLVNAVIDEYGIPDCMAIELARDLGLGQKGLSELKKEQNAGKLENEKADKEIKSCGIEPNSYYRTKYKLWTDLAKDPKLRQCPYCNDLHPISASEALSEEFEIDHILPIADSLVDSRANKVLAHRECNRNKGKRTPYEAFGHLSVWNSILAKVENLPENKKWRFRDDAWNIATGETKIDGVDAKQEMIIARMLNDTRYMSRIARQYLSFLYPDKGHGSDKIAVVNGQVTALLRSKWRLNNLLGKEDGKKSRDDHRHHAIDAVVIGCTTRGMLKKLSDAASKMYEDEKLWEKRHKIVSDMKPPFDGFFEKVKKKIDGIIISFKPEHGTQGALFDKTAYGFIKKDALEKGKEDYNLVTSMAFEDMDGNDIPNIRDKYIRNEVIAYIKKETGIDVEKAENEDGKKEKLSKEQKTVLKNNLKSILHKFNTEVWTTIPSKKRKGERSPERRSPINRIRILVVNQTVKPLDNTPYKGYAPSGYVCCDIYRIPAGKKGKWKKDEYEWKGVFRSYYEMNRPPKKAEDLKPHPAAKFIMRLYKNDTVEITEENGSKVIMRVASFSTTNNKIDLKHNTDAKSGQNFVSINGLKNKMKKITITIVPPKKDDDE